MCVAIVRYAGRGYNAALGWVQLVRSSDGASVGENFELDPFEPLGRLAHPFCWFGFAPTLFDAPSRVVREPMEWTAHSFLCFIADGVRGLETRAVVGFSWGFSSRDEKISLEAPKTLVSAAWDGHLHLLRREHPTWEFANGYRDH